MPAPKNPYMNAREVENWATGTTTMIAGYCIKPKRDFGHGGFWDAPTRSHISMGWIITKDGALATPGAGWYKTHKEAEAGLHLLIASKGDADVYHALSAAMRKTCEAIIDNNARAAALKEVAA